MPPIVSPLAYRLQYLSAKNDYSYIFRLRKVGARCRVPPQARILLRSTHEKAFGKRKKKRNCVANVWSVCQVDACKGLRENKTAVWQYLESLTAKHGGVLPDRERETKSDENHFFSTATILSRQRRERGVRGRAGGWFPLYSPDESTHTACDIMSATNYSMDRNDPHTHRH